MLETWSQSCRDLHVGYEEGTFSMVLVHLRVANQLFSAPTFLQVWKVHSRFVFETA